MTHVRQQIRESVATKLSDLPVSIHQSRVYELEEKDLSAVKIYTLSEANEFDTLGYPRGSMRELQLIVEVVVKSIVDLDDRIDFLCAGIETILSSDINLGGLTKDFYLEVTTIEFNDGGDRPHAAASMSWIAKYRISEGSPEVAIL